MNIKSHIVRRIDLKIAGLGLISFLSSFDNQFLKSIIPLYSYGIIIIRFLLLIFLLISVLKKKTRASRVTIYFFILFFLICFSTIVNGERIILPIIDYASSLVILLCLEYVAGKKEYLLKLLNVWHFLFLCVIIIDLITEFLFPNGLYLDRVNYVNWFLGYKTARMVYILPMIFIAVYVSYSRKGRLSKSIYILVVMSIINTLLSNATGASVSLVAFFILNLVINNLWRNSFKLIRKIISFILDYRIILIVNLFITLLIVFMNNSSIMAFIGDAVGKDITFSSRTIVWRACIREIIENPILGRGYLDSIAYERISSLRGGTNAHNAVLTILMNCGFLGLFIYYIMYMISLRRKREMTQCEMMLAAIVYTSWILGVTSSIFVFSTFAFIMYWVLYYESESSVVVRGKNNDRKWKWIFKI